MLQLRFIGMSLMFGRYLKLYFLANTIQVRVDKASVYAQQVEFIQYIQLVFMFYPEPEEMIAGCGLFFKRHKWSAVFRKIVFGKAAALVGYAL